MSTVSELVLKMGAYYNSAETTTYDVPIKKTENVLRDPALPTQSLVSQENGFVATSRPVPAVDGGSNDKHVSLPS